MLDILTERGLTTDLEVDGGINVDNVNVVLDAGVNVVVAGSAVFGGNIEEKTKAFMEKLDNHK